MTLKVCFGRLCFFFMQFMFETKKHWCVGVDDTGDITNWENFLKLKSEVDEELGEVHLVKGQVDENA